MPYQRTLKHEISFNGIGLHVGKKVNLTLKPAPPNTGIVFRRLDIPRSEPTRAILANVTDGKLATTIGENGTGINTVEHLLAALTGLGIDNALIELDASEIPIMDGSAEPFVKSFKAARFKFQNALKKFVVIKEPIKISCEDKYIEAYPSDRLIIECTIDYDHPMIKKQSFAFDFSYTRFIKEISSARTFCLLEEVETLRANGFAQGGSLDNAVVIDKNGVLNPEGLRFPDEFVRHKILDLIGDLSLLGHPIIGYIKAYKSGHFLNHQFLRKVLAQYNKWELTKIIPINNTFVFQKSSHSPFIPVHPH
ncbi:MAG: UDP-3-O-acyl-N-acetylglucosamine deacetylase [Pseudomonadota bacterium]